jgi:hypothetical protein
VSGMGMKVRKAALGWSRNLQKGAGKELLRMT